MSNLDINQINKNKYINIVNDLELDSSDEEDLRNTIGNVPLKWYDDYEHIGYDLDGNKIKKRNLKNNDQLDEFINKIENPDYWRTVIDNQTGEEIVLSDEDLKLIKTLTQSKYLNDDSNDFNNYSSMFMQEEMKTALSGRPEHKRSFIPSKWEKLKVGKYVHAMKMGWIKPTKPKDDPFKPKFYDLWGQDNNENKSKHYLHSLPAPKITVPGNEMSYNPPPEYLFDENEEKEWIKKEDDEKKKDLMPKKYNSLRLVPSYDQFIKERFDRCLDMYLCPRKRKMKIQIDPKDLVPNLPKARDLQPFPSQLAFVYKGHKDIINSLSIHPNGGQWIVSGSNDKSIKFWEISTSRCLKSISFEKRVSFVSWISINSMQLVSVICEESLYLVNPKLGDKIIASDTDSKIKEYHNEFYVNSSNINNTTVKWHFFEEMSDDESYLSGYRIQLIHDKILKHSTWHYKGDYIACVIDDKNSTNSIIIHQLSKQKSIVPFSKMKGIVQCVLFHPFKPILFVATQRYIKIYDLVKQTLVKKLLANTRWICCMDVHIGGDNLIIGTYDNHLSWFDLDLSYKPYKTLKHHKKAIRDVKYHHKYPLFASVSDDGNAVVYHGMVYNDLSQNALIVPLKILKSSDKEKGIRILNCQFHPTQPWLFTSATDNTIRLYTN